MEYDILDELWRIRNPYGVFFLELINFLEREEDENHISYIDNKRYYIVYNKETKLIWFYYYHFYESFKKYFKISNEQINQILIDMTKIYLDINDADLIGF